MNFRILQVTLALRSFLACCYSLEIMNDAGVYTGPEDINVYINRDGSIYTPNDEEFYVVADYGSAVLFNTTSGEVLLSAPINASTTPQEAISNVLDLALNTTDPLSFGIVTMITMKTYLQTLKKAPLVCATPEANN